MGKSWRAGRGLDMLGQVQKEGERGAGSNLAKLGVQPGHVQPLRANSCCPLSYFLVWFPHPFLLPQLLGDFDLGVDYSLH